MGKRAVGVEVIGLSRLRATMRAAGMDMSLLKNLNREAAAAVAPVARARTPIGPPAGGHIASTVRVGATQNAGIIRAGNARFPYGGPLHWGWPARGIRAQPWLMQAAQANEGRWTDIYQKGVEGILDQINGA